MRRPGGALALLGAVVASTALSACASAPGQPGASGTWDTDRRTSTATRPADRSSELPRLLIILDSSGSMARSNGRGGTSMTEAKSAILGEVDNLPDDSEVGLRVFGSTVDGHNKPTKAACSDSKLIRAVGPLDRGALKTATQRFEPLGETPIAYSLTEGIKDLGNSGNRTILLVSDGEESCSQDPCAAVEQVKQQNIDLTVHIVGLQVNNTARRQLECIANRTGGSYNEARDSSQLRDALRRAMNTLGASNGTTTTSTTSRAVAPAPGGAPTSHEVATVVILAAIIFFLFKK